MNRILFAVSEIWGVSVSEISGRDRHKTVAEARCAAYWLARKETRMSYPEIGMAMGERDHTTVRAGVLSIESRRLNDQWLNDNLNAIHGEFQKTMTEAQIQ